MPVKIVFRAVSDRPLACQWWLKQGIREIKPPPSKLLSKWSLSLYPLPVGLLEDSKRLNLTRNVMTFWHLLTIIFKVDSTSLHHGYTLPFYFCPINRDMTSPYLLIGLQSLAVVAERGPIKFTRVPVTIEAEDGDKDNKQR